MVVRIVQDNEGRGLLEIPDAVQQGAKGQSDSASTLRVLVAADHDGVCSWKIFEAMLHRMGLHFTVVPVVGNADIEDNLRQLKEDPEVRSLVLLNCGASLNLEDLLVKFEAPVEVRCFVVDAHRPLELANLSKRHTRVMVLDDDEPEFGLQALDLKQRARLAEAKARDLARGRGEEVSDDAAGSEESASDAEEEDDPDAEKENAPLGRAGGERKLSRVERAARRLERRQRRDAERRKSAEEIQNAISEYYLESYVATPVGMTLFKMARQQAVLSQDLLWWASVSLVGYYDQALIDGMTYRRLAFDELKEALERTVNTVPTSWRTQSSGSSLPTSAEDTGAPGDSTTNQGEGGGATTKTTAAGGVSDDDGAPAPKRPRHHWTPGKRSKLRFDQDLRLTLYKHWTVEESIMHTAYFYGTLELHRDKGLRSLKEFFATAGIPPSDCKQVYNEMSLPTRRELRGKFTKFGKSFGLQEKDMFLHQFVQDCGTPAFGDHSPALRLHDISCMDATLIVTALLSKVPSGLSVETLPQRPDGSPDEEAIEKLERQAAADNFWRAVEGVSCLEPKRLFEGIERAVEVAKVIQTTGRMVKDTKAIHESSQFRWCKIDNAHPLFTNPLILRKFAVWLLQVLFAYRPRNAGLEKPLLVAVRNRVRNSYICVGAMPSRLCKKGIFGYLFRTAFRNAFHNGGALHAKYDFFDKSVIEVAAEDFDRFWDLMLGLRA